VGRFARTPRERWGHVLVSSLFHTESSVQWICGHETIKRELNRRLIYECRCDERLIDERFKKKLFFLINLSSPVERCCSSDTLICSCCDFSMNLPKTLRHDPFMRKLLVIPWHVNFRYYISNVSKIFHFRLRLVCKICIGKDLLTTFFLTHARRVCFGVGLCKILVFFTGFSRKDSQKGSENDKFRLSHTWKSRFWSHSVDRFVRGSNVHQRFLGNSEGQANRHGTVIQPHTTVRTVCDLPKTERFTSGFRESPKSCRSSKVVISFLANFFDTGGFFPSDPYERISEVYRWEGSSQKYTLARVSSFEISPSSHVSRREERKNKKLLLHRWKNTHWDCNGMWVDELVIHTPVTCYKLCYNMVVIAEWNGTLGKSRVFPLLTRSLSLDLSLPSFSL
jgi:hypothetical protein